MDIFSADFAQHTVKEMDKIIPYNINVMNADGVIIASKDHERIGTFHEGALRAIQEQRTVRIYPNETFQGAKEGINMPILFQNSVLGIIGITGHPDEVESYGNIILKMTELMINEAYIKRTLQLETQAKDSFIQEWLLEQYTDEQTLKLRGETLNVNVDYTRAALVFQLNDENNLYTDLERQSWMENTLTWIRRQSDSHSQDLFLSWRTNQLVFLPSINDATEESTAQKLIDLMSRRAEGTPFKLTCGVGGKNKGIQGTIQSFKEAGHALELTQKQQPFVYYNQLGAESLLIYLADENQIDFITRHFPFMLKEEHKSLLHTLDVFFQHDQSIEKTKEALFIHKNTLQYRLKKIESLTGYNPRSFREGLLFYLALKMVTRVNI
ncbi:CdaR family transcriptional regulator [Salipaludibacillus aurantiacus]|uniref:Carbohydrate diacid regulator n=1 Tax=Salipaludibacillus aurantiacus TaxID=1601833 RepID=A0A1H9SEJ8_9BACI|nr:sugar diacid recognition domain-containing protein [Salipaludibacillus aurantiacus]SER83397.1 carbohydrate diacid regulator [Salipaludibacillus aurantiacus]